MLLFIPTYYAGGQFGEEFQYISCYCLSISWHIRKNNVKISIHLMLLFILRPLLPTSFGNYFNTSHVTVYLLPLHHLVYVYSFQYISCYCLSRTSCYTRRNILISIHLMLLFITTFCTFSYIFTLFQYISCYCLSHEQGVRHKNIKISIHLMLLFIIQA